jgi:malonate transporter MadL subunit
MVIYGVALLAFSMLLGTHLGDLIGVMIGVQANVGGGYCHGGATNPL